MPTVLASPHAARNKKPPKTAPAGEVNYYEGGRRLMVAKARIQEMKLKQLEGALVDRSSMEKEAFRCARQARDNFANFPDRLSALLHACASPEEMHAILTKEIRQCLEGLAE